MSLGQEAIDEGFIRDMVWEQEQKEKHDHQKKSGIMEIQVVGIQAQAKKSPFTFRELRPTGFVDLVHCPDNPYDKFCIEVRLDQPETGEYIQLGCIAGLKQEGVYVGSEIQKHIIDNNITTAGVVKYGYIDGQDWNDEHRGHLQAVTLQIEIPQNDSGRAIGGKYMRVTSFIKYFDGYGGGDGLIKWAFKHGATFEEYEKHLNGLSEDGTAMHDAIERFLTGSQESLHLLPDAWAAFYKKFEIDVIETETRFEDSTLRVSGKPDLVCYLRKRGSGDPFVLTVIDWKSKKQAGMSEQCQLSIYSKNKSFDGQPIEQAMVVCFNKEAAKQGYSTATYKRSTIEATYEAMILLRKMMDLAKVWVPQNKLYTHAELKAIDSKEG